MRKIYFKSIARISDQYFSSSNLEVAEFQDQSDKFTIILIPNKDNDRDIAVNCFSEIEVTEQEFNIIDVYLNNKYLLVPSSPISLPY